MCMIGYVDEGKGEKWIQRRSFAVTFGAFGSPSRPPKPVSDGSKWPCRHGNELLADRGDFIADFAEWSI